MVDLKQMSLDDLAGMVNLYPWFAAARKELGLRTGRLEDAALYVVDRRLLAALAAQVPADAAAPVRELIQDTGSRPYERKVKVLGGDFFSQEDYDGVRRQDDQIVQAVTGGIQPERDDRSLVDIDDDLCTETLARIYAEQGYIAQAKNIYSRLLLRYPEKNAYFAALIEKLDNINNQ